jgi:Amt family ammonium transporter
MFHEIKPLKGTGAATEAFLGNFITGSVSTIGWPTWEWPVMWIRLQVEQDNRLRAWIVTTVLAGLMLLITASVPGARAWADEAPAAVASAAAAPAAPAAPAATAPTNVKFTEISSGDTAWMLTSTALVLMMTIPGLALFYGGMVRKKNVLATLMQSFAITCLVSILWWIVGYTLAFTPGRTPYLGGLSRMFLNGVVYQHDAMTLSVSHLAPTIPETVYAMFQATFAIITPALICGSFAERMKFSAMLWFMGIWLLVVYCPIAHWVWEPSGWLAVKGVLDFAGGTVVHINAGIAGLATALMLGKRQG